MAIERLTLEPGRGFDPTRDEHRTKVLEAIEPMHGTGWAVQSFDPTTGNLTLVRQAAVTEVLRDDSSDSYRVGLERGTKPADGEKVASRLESDPQHRGFVMTQFDPYLGTATLSRLSDPARRCRGAVSTALRVKPWEVQVADRPDGGFDVELPGSYQPSKHNASLEEVATAIIGRPGWYLRTDARAGSASIIPGELPTFPNTVAFPVPRLSTMTTEFSPFGVALPPPGEDTLSEVGIDWTAGQMAMVAGIQGGGKSVVINDVITDWKAAGGELVIVDIPDKKNDFTWIKPWVRPGGWGCESDLAALAALELCYEEGKRRARYNEEHGVLGWRDLGPGERYKPILIVVDELSGLIVTERLPAGVPKDNPVVQRKIMSNLVRVSIEDVLQRVMREQRAMGMHVLLASQVTNNNTGIGPSVKALINHVLLQGSNQTKTQRAQAFSSEDRVPLVPQHIAEDAGAARGVGCAELGGQASAVYKGYYAPVDALKSALEELRVPTTDSQEPSPADIARFDPTREDDLDTPPPPSRGRSAAGTGGGTPNVRGLSGAAAAAHDAAVEEAAAQRARRNAEAASAR
ncbi:cell division protein FtsK [Curtobacterium sp. 20TX0008]|uniref:cell division protein FtsK n=1 Tax=Curtobacterium sp. 20TX0008 TaxID=3022018 RepID=UPI00232E2381|nr:cell division protein FtsK [Curtobacterium sp. 20TX0008]MDB6425868.1 cell division protein FtsK [Curtobacterium sp. 20TX0008]